MFVWHQLAHALARQGRVEDSIAIWKLVLAKSEAKFRLNPKDFQARNVRDSEQHNLVLTLKRMYSRSQHRIDFLVDAQQTQSVNMISANATGKTNAAPGVTEPSGGIPFPCAWGECDARKEEAPWCSRAR